MNTQKEFSILKFVLISVAVTGAILFYIESTTWPAREGNRYEGDGASCTVNSDCKKRQVCEFKPEWDSGLCRTKWYK
jgi:hypothetical protein